MSDTPPFPAVPQTRHRLLRGTELEHKSFVGMYGELTYDTTGNTVRVHDGKTAGGVALSKEGHTHDAFGGLPVPAPKITTLPFSKCRTAFRLIYGSPTSFISMAVIKRV